MTALGHSRLIIWTTRGMTSSLLARSQSSLLRRRISPNCSGSSLAASTTLPSPTAPCRVGEWLAYVLPARAPDAVDLALGLATCPMMLQFIPPPVMDLHIRTTGTDSDTDSNQTSQAAAQPKLPTPTAFMNPCCRDLLGRPEGCLGSMKWGVVVNSLPVRLTIVH